MTRLICWTCGKSVDVEAPDPQFGFELLGYAMNAGWIGSTDHERRRVLVFCSEACDGKARRKDGGFRLRPPKATP